MKTLIQLMVVALFFGGLSAAGTMFWKQRTGTPIVAAATSHDPAIHPKINAEENSAEDAELADSLPYVDDKKSEDAHPLKPPSLPKEGNAQGSLDAELRETNPGLDRSRGEAPVAVRPPYTKEGDEGGELINLLRDRAKAAIEKERRITERQDAMKLILDDIGGEQARMKKVRVQLMKELQQARQSLDSAVQGIEAERTQLQKEQDETRRLVEEKLRVAAQEQDKLRKQLEKNNASANGDENEGGTATRDENPNLKKTAAKFDAIAPDIAANIFTALIKKKQLELVVLILNSMQQKKAANVLAAISETNAELAADLTDRLRKLKTAPAPPPAQ